MSSFKKRPVTYVIAVVVALLASLLAVTAVSNSASADPEPGKKVYVCKYVGTPGENERLKDGKQPIEVSVNSIQNNEWDGTVPGWFSDAHDRSFVLGYVPMTPAPTRADCPGGDNPPTVVPVPDRPASNDPCNPPGVENNVTWRDPLPADTATIDWSENGTTRTATLVGDNVEWSDGTTAAKVFTLPADNGEQCPPNVIDVPAAATINDPCGPNNATWNVPANTNVLSWSVDNGHLVVKILGVGVTFPGGATTHDYGVAKDSGDLCPPGVIPVPTVPVNDPCGPNNAAYGDVPPGDYTVTRNADGSLTLTATGGLAFPTGKSVTLPILKDSGKPCPSSGDDGDNQGNGGHNPTPVPTGNLPAPAHTGH